MRAIHPVAVLVGLTLLYGCSSGGPGAGVRDGTDGTDGTDPVAGRELFARNCAVCHGEQAQGTSQGPPLVHELYVPSHHADESFQVAVARGVQPHHWEFGAMPPIPSLTRDDVADITAHVRDVQVEAGLLDDAGG